MTSENDLVVRGMILKQLVHSLSSLLPPLVSQTEDLIQDIPRMSLLIEQCQCFTFPALPSPFSPFPPSLSALGPAASSQLAASWPLLGR